jgi:two-component system, cell cycle response regulator DivK
MVVDDSDDIRQLISVTLEAHGYRVVEARNGQEALTCARARCPDLILMDLSMPVLDGFGAVRKMREIAEMCKIPIIAVSAHDTIDHRAKALNIGFNDYLTKPINFTLMDNLIRRFLPAV